jgi:hypothetical protein
MISVVDEYVAQVDVKPVISKVRVIVTGTSPVEASLIDVVAMTGVMVGFVTSVRVRGIVDSTVERYDSVAVAVRLAVATEGW